MAKKKTVMPPEATGAVRTDTARARYMHLEVARRPFLERARRAALLTIPSLMPPEGHSGASELPQPFQSTGADGVNNLASWLALVLFPPTGPFFRLSMNDFVLEQLKKQAGDEFEQAQAEFQAALGKIERAVKDRMEEKGNRTENGEVLKHLIVAGNCLVSVKADGSEKFFPLDRYVVKRDLDGNVLEIIVKECLDRRAVPTNIQALLTETPESVTQRDEKNIEVFTWIQRTEHGAWTVHQEVEDKIVSGSEGTYPKDKSAWLPLRWTKVAGEDYGRGRCEEYGGDLKSFEALSQAITEWSGAAARGLILVDEGGTTRKADVAQAPNWSVRDGRAQDISILTLEKFADFQITKSTYDDKKASLEKAFLLVNGIQRNAERVTAEEIRVMVNALEKSLGGVYAILSTEFQRPLVVRVMHQMQTKGELPQLPDGAVSPQIITGLEGLGRSSDVERLDALVADVAQQFGPEAVSEYINVGGFLKLKAAGLGINTDGILRTEQEVQQSRQQKQQGELMQSAVGPGIKALSDHSLAAQQQQQQQAAGATPQ